MKTFTITIHHTGSGTEKLCLMYPKIASTSFCMACAIAEKMALSHPQTGIITKMEVEQEK